MLADLDQESPKELFNSYSRALNIKHTEANCKTADTIVTTLN